VSAWSVRLATEADADTIRRLAEEGLATYSELMPGWTRPKEFDENNAERGRTLLADPEFFCLIAEVDGEPIAHVGFAQLREDRGYGPPIEGRAHLWQLFVTRELWGSGVAAELIQAAVEEARSRGYERMRLFTPRDHARARRFYEREGWRPTGLEIEGDLLGLAIVEYAIDL
jgi:GNAT superfamily N-acetyltransferase